MHTWASSLCSPKVITNNMLVLTVDVDTSSRIQAFKEKYPDRCYNVGIAEQNLMSVSAGLAHEGFRPLAFAFAPFASMRCYEQVRTDICLFQAAGRHHRQRRRLFQRRFRLHALRAGGLRAHGRPQQHDGSRVGDPFQIAKLLETAMELNALSTSALAEATSSLYPEDTNMRSGKALIPREGDDGAFICTGIMVHFAMEAAKRIHDELGKEIRRYVHDQTADKQAVIDAVKTGPASSRRRITTRLAALVGSCIAEAGIARKLVSRGCPDYFVPIANPEFLYARNGMDADGLRTSKEILEK